MVDKVTTAVEVVGAACVVVALWSVAWQLGLALTGVLLVLGGFLVGDR